MATLVTKDGTELFYKDWGSGQPVVFSQGWPLSSEAWAGQMLFLSQHGYRVIALDRRGHGRSSQTSSGNDMNTYADYLAQVIDHLDLKNVVLVGHSTGGGEVTRYIGRHGTKRVDKVVLIAAVPPILLKSAHNPEGIPLEVFDGWRADLAKDPSQFYKNFANVFYGANRTGAKISQGMLDQFWLWSMQGSVKSIYQCIQAFSETDFTDDLKKFDAPTLLVRVDDEQIVPVAASSKKSGNLIPGAAEIYYPGGAHSITATEPELVTASLLEFPKTGRRASKAA